MQLIRPNQPTPPAEEDTSSPVPQRVLDAIRTAIESDEEQTRINDMTARHAADYVKLAHQPVGAEDR